MRLQVSFLASLLFLVVSSGCVDSTAPPAAEQASVTALQQRLDQQEAALAAMQSDVEVAQYRISQLGADLGAQGNSVDSLVAAVSELPAPQFTHCFWVYRNCQGTTAECTVDCDDFDGGFGDTDDYTIVAGGCDLAAGSSLSESRPTVANSEAFPPQVSERAYDRWACEPAEGTVQNAYAHCCR